MESFISKLHTGRRHTIFPINLTCLCMIWILLRLGYIYIFKLLVHDEMTKNEKRSILGSKNSIIEMTHENISYTSRWNDWKCAINLNILIKVNVNHEFVAFISPLEICICHSMVTFSIGRVSGSFLGTPQHSVINFVNQNFNGIFMRSFLQWIFL